VAASFTAQPLEPSWASRCWRPASSPSFHFAEYNQIHQVCYDPVAAVGEINRLIILWRIEDMFGAALERAVAGDATAIGDIADAAAELGGTIGPGRSQRRLLLHRLVTALPAADRSRPRRLRRGRAPGERRLRLWTLTSRRSATHPCAGRT